jgi:hypothetical protein
MVLNPVGVGFGIGAYRMVSGLCKQPKGDAFGLD